MNIPTKLCYYCKKLKPISEFSRMNHEIQDWCRACSSRYRKNPNELRDKRNRDIYKDLKGQI